MKTSEERKAYLKEYWKNNMRRISFALRNDEYDRVHAHVVSRGDSMNGFIKQAINEKIIRDLEGKADPPDRKAMKSIISKVVHDRDLVYNCLLPEMIYSRLDVVEIIKYLLDGEDLGAIGTDRLTNYQSRVRFSRTLVELWESRGDGNYTIYDFPDWVFETVSKEDAFEVVLKQSGFQENCYDFTRINRQIHFTLTGYKKIIWWMEDHKMIPKAVAEKWEEEIQLRCDWG